MVTKERPFVLRGVVHLQEGAGHKHHANARDERHGCDGAAIPVSTHLRAGHRNDGTGREGGDEVHAKVLLDGGGERELTVCAAGRHADQVPGDETGRCCCVALECRGWGWG